LLEIDPKASLYLTNNLNIDVNRLERESRSTRSSESYRFDFVKGGVSFNSPKAPYALTGLKRSALFT